VYVYTITINIQYAQLPYSCDCNFYKWPISMIFGKQCTELISNITVIDLLTTVYNYIERKQTKYVFAALQWLDFGCVYTQKHFGLSCVTAGGFLWGGCWSRWQSVSPSRRQPSQQSVMIGVSQSLRDSSYRWLRFMASMLRTSPQTVDSRHTRMLLAAGRRHF